MDLGSLLVIFSVLILVAIFISRPFFQSQTGGETSISGKDKPDRERSEILAEYDRTLNALQELDFDNTLGKIPAEEYPIQRAELVTAGAAALSRLDAILQETPAQSVEARLEAAIAARRADISRERAVVPGGARSAVGARGQDPVEELIATRRQGRVEKSGGFCPLCGKPVQKSDRFCPRCGATLSS
jgi:hypothetical protein